MKTLPWEQVPGSTKTKDCFADTPAGRYYICRTVGRDKHYVLKLNGALVIRQESLALARQYAEKIEAGNELD
jgi:hypothetical protein